MKKILGAFVVLILISSCSVNKSAISDHSKVTKWIKPPDLQKGDTIAILSPASYLSDKQDAIQNALDSISSWGLHYKLSTHVFDRDHRFAGSDIERASDFQKAIDDPNIKAIWCARGGYGSVRILDKLHLDKLKTNPKWIIGYSDVTAIHNMLHNFGVQSIHGVMPVSFRDTVSDNGAAIQSLKNNLFGIENSYTVESTKFNKLGKATGVLVGGNLSLLESMLGSKTSINTTDKIIFIEDIGEYTYRIDRMMQSLKRAGYFDNCKAVIFGGFSDMKEHNPAFCDGIELLMLEILQEYNIPIVFNFPTGHISDNRSMVIGAEVSLEVNKQTTELFFVK